MGTSQPHRSGVSTPSRAAEALARGLHADPEIGLDEYRAAERCQAFLSDHGFRMLPVPGMDTAFRAERADDADDHEAIGLIAEYDALPGVGHGCGHHLIAGAILEAAARLAQDERCDRPVVVLGTPAEELFAGKVAMLELGAFHGVSEVIGYHPLDSDGVVEHMNGAAILRVDAAGVSSHAGASPWNGRSAEDAISLGLHALAMERQYLREGERLHGTVEANDGSHNVLSSAASALINIRSPSKARLELLERRVHEMFTGAATATSTRVSLDVVQRALPLAPDPDLMELAARAMRLPEAPRIRIGGSTDLGDVSHEIPTVLLARAGWTPVTWHSDDLHRAAGGPGAYAAMHRAADDIVALCHAISDRDRQTG